jgi:ABC-type transport system substrate-binding protein
MDITVDNVSDYIGSLGYTQAYYDEREVTFLSINTESPLLSDSKTRKALALYIDKTNIIANLGSGYTESDFLLSSKNWIYHSKLNYSTNYEEADNLLKEAGWSYLNNEWINEEGKVLTFSIKVDLSKSDRVTTANVIASQLANHGIEVNVIEENSNAYTSDLNSKNYEVILAGYKNGYSPKITDLFKDDNIANYSSSTVKELVNNIKSTSDYNEKQENYNKLYDEYLNDFPYIFLYRKTNSVVYNQTLCGKITPNAYSIFYNIEKWYRQ